MLLVRIHCLAYPLELIPSSRSAHQKISATGCGCLLCSHSGPLATRVEMQVPHAKKDVATRRKQPDLLDNEVISNCL